MCRKVERMYPPPRFLHNIVKYLFHHTYISVHYQSTLSKMHLKVYCRYQHTTLWNNFSMGIMSIYMVFFYWDTICIQWNAQILSEHSLSFDKWTHLCSPKPYQDTDHDYCPRKFPSTPSYSISLTLLGSLLSTGLLSLPSAVSCHFTNVRHSVSNLWPHFICNYLGGMVQEILKPFQESTWGLGLCFPGGWEAFPPNKDLGVSNTASSLMSI